ncbi:MAG: hypothetical protein JST00_44945 [Deltaproteobacteria bacterium]|nr:hypothetical protein [Deltaproteobacteria bacterium]
MRTFQAVKRALPRLGLLLLLAACGSRTGLFGTEPLGSTPGTDGGTEGGVRDGGPLVDGQVPDALPPIDATPRPDANRVDCPDAEATYVYLISADYELLSFDPATGNVKTIGNIACPAVPEATPFSMAVDRKGVAYILFSNQTGGPGSNPPDDGRLFRVSTATAACIGTSFVPNQLGFRRFGMGFATNDIGPTEALFVAGSEQANGAEGLGRIDVSSFVLSKVANFNPVIHNAELTGTGDGRLFGLYTKNTNNDPPTYIGEINTTTGAIVGEKRFDDVDLGNGWAFAFWGGDFYMFTAPSGSTEITRWRPSNDTTQVIASLPNRIVGAGVSTCAPQQ